MKKECTGSRSHKGRETLLLRKDESNMADRGVVCAYNEHKEGSPRSIDLSKSPSTFIPLPVHAPVFSIQSFSHTSERYFGSNNHVITGAATNSLGWLMAGVVVTVGRQ